jgi:PhoPQ-activated pathogenicity-related protein
MPKMVVNAGGDEFFMPDDTHYWWNDMPEPKRFLMVPNSDHTQETGLFEIVPAIGAWLRLVEEGRDAPVFTWEREEGNGQIIVFIEQSKSVKVNMWHATTCNGERRDFRLVNIDNPCTCGVG